MQTNLTTKACIETKPYNNNKFMIMSAKVWKKKGIGLLTWGHEDSITI